MVRIWCGLSVRFDIKASPTLLILHKTSWVLSTRKKKKNYHIYSNILKYYLGLLTSAMIALALYNPKGWYAIKWRKKNRLGRILL